MNAPAWAWITVAVLWSLAALAGWLLGRYLERRRQDARIDTAIRLARATEAWRGATLAELDQLTSAIAHIDAEDEIDAAMRRHPAGRKRPTDG